VPVCGRHSIVRTLRRPTSSGLLDDAPPLLRHRAWRDGDLLIDRDPRTRVRDEARALVEYLDTKPLREQTALGVSHRLAEGRFGRR
jgi:hypothetical protein